MPNIPSKITKFLEKNKIKYESIEHRTVYTARDKAATLKVSPKIVGKTLIVNLDKQLALILIPANENLDKNKLKKKAKAKKVDFVTERVIKNKLKGVRVGAVPPFGNLWKLPTFVESKLMRKPKIIVNGGDYKWSIKITPAVFRKIVPDLVIGNFSKGV